MTPEFRKMITANACHEGTAWVEKQGDSGLRELLTRLKTADCVEVNGSTFSSRNAISIWAVASNIHSDARVEPGLRERAGAIEALFGEHYKTPPWTVALIPATPEARDAYAAAYIDKVLAYLDEYKIED